MRNRFFSPFFAPKLFWDKYQASSGRHKQSTQHYNEQWEVSPEMKIPGTKIFRTQQKFNSFFPEKMLGTGRRFVLSYWGAFFGNFSGANCQLNFGGCISKIGWWQKISSNIQTLSNTPISTKTRVFAETTLILEPQESPLPRTAWSNFGRRNFEAQLAFTAFLELGVGGSTTWLQFSGFHCDGRWWSLRTPKKAPYS